MTLSEELIYRGFLEKTTYDDPRVVDQSKITFYWGVDPSSESMTIGNLATAMLVKHFIKAGHSAVLLIGGATGLIGDPDGKAQERDLASPEVIDKNKQAITAQYKKLFADQPFEVVDNYDWFKDLNYLTFLRDIGKHVPMRQMLGREFVQSRLGETGSGISYAEFSYSLIQGYDFLYLFNNKGVTLQLAGSDQWGNSIAGVELIRRITGKPANIWVAPLIADNTTGRKFGKTEDGAIWLDSNKTTPTGFYQFWINVRDDQVEQFLKTYTMLSKEEIDQVTARQAEDRKSRIAQKTLAKEVTNLLHGPEATKLAEAVTSFLTNERSISEASEEEITAVRSNIHSTKVSSGISLIEALVSSGLASSNTQAKDLITSKAIYINGQTFDQPNLDQSLFTNGRLIIRRGKAFKDSALLEL